MAENSNIEWCDHTFNPWEGCQHVSPGCDHCYAENRNQRWNGGTAPNWGPGAPRRRTSPATWARPVAWQKAAERFRAQHGRRQRVFCASLADVFDNAVDETWRLDLFWLIHKTPDLDWLLLTKRIANAASMIRDAVVQLDPAGQWPVPLPNVWVGATVTSQEEADRDVPKLLRVPSVVRFLSIEPMLAPIDLTRIVLHSGPIDLLPTAPVEWQGVQSVNIVMDATRPGKQSGRRAIDWVICGGENARSARPMHADWARSLRDQCAEAGVPFLFKQWGSWLPAGQDGAHDHEPLQLNASDEPMRVGKKAAGRLLDGRTHDGFPAANGVGHG